MLYLIYNYYNQAAISLVFSSCIINDILNNIVFEPLSSSSRAIFDCVVINRQIEWRSCYSWGPEGNHNPLFIREKSTLLHNHKQILYELLVLLQPDFVCKHQTCPERSLKFDFHKLAIVLCLMHANFLASNRVPSTTTKAVQINAYTQRVYFKNYDPGTLYIHECLRYLPCI